MRVPAVVGSFPEPFLHGADGKRFPVRIDCARERGRPVPGGIGASRPRRCRSQHRGARDLCPGTSCCVWWSGRWEDVRGDNATQKLQEGPGESGVFARVRRGGAGYEIDALDSRGRVVQTLGSGTGIVAATRFEEQQPTWTVSGTDEAGLDRAVASARCARAAKPVSRSRPRSAGRWAFRRPRRGRDELLRARVPAHRLGSARRAPRRRCGVCARALRGRAHLRPPRSARRCARVRGDHRGRSTCRARSWPAPRGLPSRSRCWSRRSIPSSRGRD